MRIDFDKLTKGVLIFSFLLVAFSFFYYYVIFLPQKEEARLGQQRQEQLAKEEQEQQALDQELFEKKEAEKNLNKCLLDAEFSYFGCWDSHCEILGREESCELPFERADRCKEQRKQDKDYCFKKYPQK